MALTPEDVVNKRFQQTKFREGYDQDEVDDFLDEIVVELRRLIAENEELRRTLDGAAQGQGAAVPVTTPDTGQAAAQNADFEQREQALTQREQELAAREEAVKTAESQQQGPVAGPATPTDTTTAGASGQTSSLDQLSGIKDDPATPENEAESSNSLLVLARRLHDEHIAEGTRRRDELIAEGRTQASKVVADAELTAKNVATEGEARARQLVTEAESRERETVGRAEEQKQKIEARIEELRIFEREYRNELRTYIEGQLNDLNKQSSNVEPQGPAAQQQ